MTLKNLIKALRTDKPVKIIYSGLEPVPLTPRVAATMGDLPVKQITVDTLDITVELEDERNTIPTALAACHC